jgi:hypothetical protein
VITTALSPSTLVLRLRHPKRSDRLSLLGSLMS